MTLEVNGVYAGHGECFAREVISIEKGQVRYRDFLIEDGTPLSLNRICSRAVFRKWIARTCKASEVARFRRDEVPQHDQLLAGIIRKNLLP